MTVQKGDQVAVIAGRDKGQKGTVEKVIPSTNKVIVGGVNIIKRHLKPTRNRPKGGIVEIPAAFSRANVMVICPHCSKPTRVAHTVTADAKYRSCSHCKDSLDTKK